MPSDGSGGLGESGGSDRSDRSDGSGGSGGLGESGGLGGSKEAGMDGWFPGRGRMPLPLGMAQAGRQGCLHHKALPSRGGTSREMENGKWKMEKLGLRSRHGIDGAIERWKMENGRWKKGHRSRHGIDPAVAGMPSISPSFPTPLEGRARALASPEVSAGGLAGSPPPWAPLRSDSASRPLSHCPAPTTLRR